MAAKRVILHVDMDAFFAAIEQLDQPELRGKPVLVGHDGPRGVVATASYEARPFGCGSAMPMAIAKRRCPQAIVVPVRGWRYREVSRKLFDIFDAFSPLVEPLSIDEAFLDATGSERLFGPPREMAQRLKQRIRDELQVTGSVGVAPNKFLAKLASDMDKPDGLTIIEPDAVDALLGPLPIGRMWGIGPKNAERLERIGVRTIGDLRARSRSWLEQHFGGDAERYHRLSRGIDDRPVTPDSEARSISHEQTFGYDIDSRDEVRRVLREHVEQVARRLRKHQLCARTVTLKIRYGQFETITRSTTLQDATHDSDLLWRASKMLFDRWASGSFRPVRLIGMGASQLVRSEGQLELFEDPNRRRQQQVDQVADELVNRFGRSAIRRGGTMG